MTMSQIIKKAKVEFNITGDLFKRKSEENFGTVKIKYKGIAQNLHQ